MWGQSNAPFNPGQQQFSLLPITTVANENQQHGFGESLQLPRLPLFLDNTFSAQQQQEPELHRLPSFYVDSFPGAEQSAADETIMRSSVSPLPSFWRGHSNSSSSSWQQDLRTQTQPTFGADRSNFSSSAIFSHVDTPRSLHSSLPPRLQQSTPYSALPLQQQEWHLSNQHQWGSEGNIPSFRDYLWNAGQQQLTLPSPHITTNTSLLFNSQHHLQSPLSQRAFTPASHIVSASPSPNAVTMRPSSAMVLGLSDGGSGKSYYFPSSPAAQQQQQSSALYPPTPQQPHLFPAHSMMMRTNPRLFSLSQPITSPLAHSTPLPSSRSLQKSTTKSKQCRPAKTIFAEKLQRSASEIAALREKRARCKKNLVGDLFFDSSLKKAKIEPKVDSSTYSAAENFPSAAVAATTVKSNPRSVASFNVHDVTRSSPPSLLHLDSTHLKAVETNASSGGTSFHDCFGDILLGTTQQQRNDVDVDYIEDEELPEADSSAAEKPIADVENVKIVDDQDDAKAINVALSSRVLSRSSSSTDDSGNSNDSSKWASRINQVLETPERLQVQKVLCLRRHQPVVATTTKALQNNVIRAPPPKTPDMTKCAAVSAAHFHQAQSRQIFASPPFVLLHAPEASSGIIVSPTLRTPTFRGRASIRCFSSSFSPTSSAAAEKASVSQSPRSSSVSSSLRPPDIDSYTGFRFVGAELPAWDQAHPLQSLQLQNLQQSSVADRRASTKINRSISSRGMGSNSHDENSFDQAGVPALPQTIGVFDDKTEKTEDDSGLGLSTSSLSYTSTNINELSATRDATTNWLPLPPPTHLLLPVDEPSQRQQWRPPEHHQQWSPPVDCFSSIEPDLYYDPAATELFDANLIHDQMNHLLSADLCFGASLTTSRNTTAVVSASSGTKTNDWKEGEKNAPPPVTPLRSKTKKRKKPPSAGGSGKKKKCSSLLKLEQKLRFLARPSASRDQSPPDETENWRIWRNKRVLTDLKFRIDGSRCATDCYLNTLDEVSRFSLPLVLNESSNQLQLSRIGQSKDQLFVTAQAHRILLEKKRRDVAILRRGTWIK